MARQKVILVCDVCLSRNYDIFKNEGSIKKLEISKFCKVCNKHTKHIESR